MPTAGPTFSVLNQTISKRLIDVNNTAISSADVGTAINDAIVFWKQKPFWFNQKTASVVMDINDPFIMANGVINSKYPLAPQLPSDFLWEEPENGFVIQYNQLSYSMKKKHPREYDAVNVQGNGLPRIYTWRDGNYEFYFYPNLAYTMNIYYYKEYAALVQPGDTNDFLTYADKLIEYDAIGRLLSDIRLDDDRAERFMKRAEAEYSNLKMRSRKQAATGQLVTETILE
jgi:hypothetical protein